MAAEKNLRFRMSFLNRPLSVISLGEEEDGSSQAMSTNYLKVSLGKAAVKPNQLLEVMVKGCTSDGVSAEVLA
jgi:hypothetical protein